MKKMLLTGIALGLGVAFASAANAQIKIGVAGPITGPNAAFGAQLKNGTEQAVEDINAAGGVMGQKLVLSVGDDVSDPKQGVSVANKFAAEGIKWVVGHFNSGVSIPSSDVYQGSRHHPDDAGLDEPAFHRSPGYVEHLPHLRPRRPAGRGRRQLSRQELQGQEGRRRPRQDPLRQGPRRRDPEGDEQAGPEGGHVRGHQHRREGLLGPRLEAEAGERRRRLFRRSAHRSRARSSARCATRASTPR